MTSSAKLISFDGTSRLSLSKIGIVQFSCNLLHLHRATVDLYFGNIKIFLHLSLSETITAVNDR